MPVDRVARRSSGWCTLTLASFCLLLLARAAADEELPKTWLERMSHAAESLNYEGTLVHMHGGDVDVLQVVHRVENGKVTERITAQSDAGREVIRSGAEETWILPDRQAVLVGKRLDRAAGPALLGGRLPNYSRIAEAYYNVAFTEAGRIAGRDARGIAIRPKDSYRYGYRLWLDRATAMPLKTQLLSEQGEVMEQQQFTKISLPDRIPKSAVRPSRARNSFARQHWDAARDSSEPVPTDEWTTRQLPPGFVLTARNAETTENPNSGLRHLVYSDGLASVSVFLDLAVAASEQAEGLSQVGAANAYTTTLDGRLVTAMGEVPARTVQMIALSTGPAASRKR